MKQTSIRHKKWRDANREHVRESMRARYAKNPEYFKSYQRRYRENNKEALRAKKRKEYASNRDAVLMRSREWRRNNPDKLRIQGRRRLGILNPTAETRSGECPICKRHMALVPDHDHSTGVVRGWICSGCNLAIDWAMKNIDHISLYMDSIGITQ